jgi:hypothetical protein
MRLASCLVFACLTSCGPVLDYILTGDPDVYGKKEKNIQEQDEQYCSYPQPKKFDESFTTDEGASSCLVDLPVYEQENTFALAGRFALNLPKAAQGGQKLLALQKELLNVSKAFGSAHEDLTDLPTFDADVLLQAPSLPESVQYVGEGVYRMEVNSGLEDPANPTTLTVEYTFLYGDDYGSSKKGEEIKHDLFALDSYITAGVATGIFPKFKISFLQTGPLFPLLGLGSNIPSPIEVDGANLKDLTKEFRKLDVKVSTRIDINGQDKCWRLGAGFVSSLRLFAEGSAPLQYTLPVPVITAYHNKYKQSAEALESTLKFLENGGGSLAGGVTLQFVGLQLSFNSKTDFAEGLDPKTVLSCN